VLRPAVVLSAVLIVTACSPDKGFGETTELSASDFGSAWPLTVSTAKVNKICDDDTSVALMVDGETFVISGVVVAADADSAFVKYWLEDNASESGRKDLTPLVAEGEALCD